MKNVKTNLLICCILFFTVFLVSSAVAQNTKGFTDKGNILIAGTISFTSNFGELYSLVPYDTGKIMTIQVSPKVLYFIYKNVALGGEFSIAHQWVKLV